VRRRLLSRPGVEVLAVPLADALGVQTAMELPRQLAHRFEAERLVVAVIATTQELPPELIAYRLPTWPEG
jgi:hypothetical protein